jgi:hypothetical protein
VYSIDMMISSSVGNSVIGTPKVLRCFLFTEDRGDENRGGRITLYERQMSARDVANLGKSADDG